jgi:hypothetical protein
LAGKHGMNSLTTNRLSLFAAGSTAVALAVYLSTLAPDLTWANAAMDGGELITASVTLGVPHPPGYPAYVLLGKLFTLLPLGTVAYRYNLFSAVCMAGAVGLLALAIGSLFRTRISAQVAATAALLFAFTPLVWGQAIVAEVYALNSLALAAFLLAWSRRAAPIQTGLWLGLAVTTHLTSLLMLPLALTTSRRPRVLAGFVLGLAPLLLLPWLARGSSPVVWGDPTDPGGWWWLASARLYANNLQLLPDSARLIGLLPLALVPVGCIIAHKMADSGFTGGRWSAWLRNNGSTTMVLILTAALYGLFALLYDTPDAAIIVIPGLMLLALLIAPGLERLGAAALLLPAFLALALWSAQDLSQDRQPRVMAEALLQAAPAGAILLTPGDRTIFTLWYFHHIEGQRPDLRLVDANLFAFDWYRERLSQQYPDIQAPRDDDLVAWQQANEGTRPVCLAGLIDKPGKLPSGTARAVLPTGEPPYLFCSLKINGY